MGTRAKSDGVQFTEESIGKVLDRGLLSNPRYLIHNLYVFGWESDFLAETRSGYWYEVEIKISLADFKKDFEKKDKHTSLRFGRGRRPHYFSYCVPSPLVDKVLPLVPPYAGLYAVNEYRRLIPIKPAPKLHTEKYTDDDLKLAEKFYYNWESEKRKNKDHDEIVRQLRYQLRTVKEEFKAELGYSIDDVL